MRREIVRVLTPGTVLEDHFSTPERENNLCAVVRSPASNRDRNADVSTVGGALNVLADDDAVAAELGRIAPARSRRRRTRRSAS